MKLVDESGVAYRVWCRKNFGEAHLDILPMFVVITVFES